MSSFEYLERSSLEEMGRVRTQVDRWFYEYPETNQTGISARLLAGNVSFSSTVFELQIHSMLKGAGHEILSVEPSLPHTPKTPDFYVKSPCGVKYYLELTEARDQTVDQARSTQLQGIIAARLDSINSSEFFLNIRWCGEVTRLDGIRRQIGLVRHWLAGFDYATERARGTSPTTRVSNPPSMSVDTEHYKFDLSLHPRDRPKNAPETWLGGQSFEARWVSAGQALKSSVEKKATRYGELERPYVIAVNVHDFAISRDTEMEAFYGSLALVIQRSSETGEPTVKREEFGGEGCFLRWGNPINTRVSGVLVFRALSMYGARGRPACLYLHPTAQHPVTFDYGYNTCSLVQGNRIERTVGQTVNSSLGLSDTWPDAT